MKSLEDCFQRDPGVTYQVKCTNCQELCFTDTGLCIECEDTITCECSNCTYQKIKAQVDGIAHIYIRAAKSNHSGVILEGRWCIYVVRKGEKLKDIVNAGNWEAEVTCFPLVGHLDQIASMKRKRKAS